MRRNLAVLGTILIMGAVLWTGLRSPVRTSPEAGASVEAQSASAADFETPHSPILDPGFHDACVRLDRLFESALRGDVAGYLAAFGGALQARLEREAQESGRDAFAGELRRTAAARKGHAVFAPEPDGDESGAVRIVVESTFADRIERQTYRLRRGAAGWLITEVETARDRIPRNKLGSPATYEEPEGVPVEIGGSGKEAPQIDADDPG
jgi:hypothetical protein